MFTTHTRRFRPGLEALEDRNLMTVVPPFPPEPLLPPFPEHELVQASLSNGVLSVVGTRGIDLIEVHREVSVSGRLSRDEIIVEGTNTSDPFAGKQRFTFDTRGVLSIRIDGKAGGDTVNVSSDGGSAIHVPCEITGGLGNDWLSGGAGSDILYGDEGVDNLNGNGGKNWLYGDDDADILYGTAGEDVLEGGRGDDTLHVLFDINRFVAGHGQAIAPPAGADAGVDTMIIQVDMYALVHDYIGPVVTNVQKVTGSLQGVVDFFNEPVPVLSKYSDQTGIHTFTDLISKAVGDGFKTFLGAVEDVNKLDVSALASGVVDGGTFTLTAGNHVESVDSAPDLPLPSYFGDLQSLRFNFEIVEDRASLAHVVLGEDVELFRYQLPELNINFSFTQAIYIPTPILVPLKLSLTETLSLGAKATFGLDTFGIHSGNLMDGFFIADPAVTLGLTITGEASLSIYVAEAGVFGRLSGQITIQPEDPDHDGKIRLHEIRAIDQFFVSSTQLCYDVGLFASFTVPLPFGFSRTFRWEESLDQGCLSL